jgi:hypothetical protein
LRAGDLMARERSTMVAVWTAVPRMAITVFRRAD